LIIKVKNFEINKFIIVKTFSNHRIAMSFSILNIILKNKVKN
jgi:hypothetical protein